MSHPSGDKEGIWIGSSDVSSKRTNETPDIRCVWTREAAKVRDDLINVGDDTVIGKDLIASLNIDTSTYNYDIVASWPIKLNLASKLCLNLSYIKC